MRPTYFCVSSITAVVVLLMLVGCSGDGGALAPPKDIERITHGNHAMLGMWQFTADPVAETLDIVPMRVSGMHLNALPFLEPPPFLNLTLESLEFNGDILEADIGLRHPFLGLTRFSGFDVCGVLITNGSITGFDNSDLVMAGGDDTYLMNADGLTRWWNPSEFPHDGTILGYKDGLLGTPDGVADFNSTLNAYKFYCDDLTDPDGPVSDLDPDNICMFTPGQQNIRHYSIHIGTEGLVFNYAIDASWEFPQDDPPWEAPDDFGEGASRVEAWNIAVTELSNTLFNDGTVSGGELSLLIDVWDHYNADLNTVIAESPGNITMASSDMPIGGGDGYSTYQVDITGATPAGGSIDVLIEVECEESDYQGLLSGETITAYFLHTADVSTSGFVLTIPNGGEEWTGLAYEEITWNAIGTITHVDLYYSKDDFGSDINTIVEDYENTGSYDWFVPNDPSTTVKVKVVDSNSTLEDESDSNFTIEDGECIIYVDDDNTTAPFLGTLEDPFQYVQDGVDNAPDDCTVWIKPGTYYEDLGGDPWESDDAEVTITDKSNLTLHGEDMPVIVAHRYYGPPWPSGIRATNCPGLVIEGIEINLGYHNQAYFRLTNCADAVVKNCVGHPDVADSSGGAHSLVFAQSCPNLLIENNSYVDTTNASTNSNHLYISSCNNAVITLNTITNNANGTNVHHTFTSWLTCSNSSDVEISKNILGHHNKVAGADEYQSLHGISISGGSGVVVRNNLIYDLSFHNSNLTAESRNWALRVANSPSVEIYNNTIDNFGPGYASGLGYTYAIKLEGSTTSSQFHSNILSNIFANGGSTCYGVYSDSTFTQTYSDVWNLAGLTTQRYGGSAAEGTGGINLNPLYVNPTAWNYHLQAGSPCEDTGLNGNDMGCYGGADPLP